MGMLFISLKFSGKERKNKIAQGASIVSEVIQIISVILRGSERKGFPEKNDKKLVMRMGNTTIQSGIPKYQRFDLLFISDMKRREPKSETTLNNCGTAIAGNK